MRLAITAAALLAAILAWSALDARPASGYLGITKFVMEPNDTQAGGHPDIMIEGHWNNRAFLNQEIQPDAPAGCNCQDVKDILIHFPTGFIGNPHNIPKCTTAEFALNDCSPDTQVGVVFLAFGEQTEGPVKEMEEKLGEPFGFVSPIYNLQPHPGKAGAIGSVAPLIELPIETQLSARTGSDYGLDAQTLGIFHWLPIPRLSMYIWGNPADPSHDKARFPLPHGPGQNACGGTPNNQVEDPSSFFFGCHPVTPSAAANKPYLEAPTTCGVPLTSTLELVYYDHNRVQADAPWPPTTGCDQLKFSPSMTAEPTTTQADTASGLDLNLHVPQTQNPTVPSPSQLRETKVTLPAGFSLTSGGSDGKVACPDASLNFTTEEAAECPEFSKIGTVTIDSSALPGPIHGGIYIGEPLPGQRFRIFMTASGFSTNVKLKGNVKLDPETGQIVTTFSDLPQSPFEDFDMHFFGAERGIFATPTRCGTYKVETEFTPWAAALPKQTSIATFELDSGPNGSPCPDGPRPFSPAFKAGTPDNTAGVSTPLHVQVKRPDGDQTLTGLDVSLPKGLIQSIRGVTECPQVALDTLALTSHTGLLEAETPACPSSSQIGTIVVGSGVGTRGLYNPGKVFLAGPYRGAALSIVTVIPAVGGPYDLGNVTVRTAAFVDPVTAQVRAISDPLPQILEGVPLRVRSVLLSFERNGFNLTPTNCDPKSIDATISGDEGASSVLSAYYQVANCRSLPFDPRLGMRLTGGVRRLGHPAIHATLKTQPGEANLSSVSVTLPKGELLDNSHIGTVCTNENFAKRTCPDGSLIGTATAATPLLDQPLSGPVYLRSSRHRLPDLVFDLRGQVGLVVAGRVDSVSGRLRTTFEDLPDAPLAGFRLSLLGGKKGLLSNSESLCGVVKRATVVTTGQNGARRRTRPKLQVRCGANASAVRRVLRVHKSKAVR
jgi:hypothetical protein